MKYEKAMAEVVILDNTDVITTSTIDCKNPSANGAGGCPSAQKKNSITPNVVEEFWGEQA